MDDAFGRKLDDETPVRLSHRDRFTGTYIVGKMGMGKSTLIQQLAREQINNGHGLLVMEPKGDLVVDLLKLIPKQRVNDVILLDYGDRRHPPGFDIFDMAGIEGVAEQSTYISEIVAGFEKTLGKDAWGMNIQTLFMAIGNTFTQNPGVVLSDIKKILTNDAFRARCVRNLKGPFTKDARDFWQTYDRMKGKDTYINGVMSRVQEFLFKPILQMVTVQAGHSLDVTKAIKEQKIVLIVLPERTLGESGMELLGTLYLSRIRLATQQQFEMPEAERVPFFVYLDEFQRFASGDIESFIAEARGAKVGLTMAHQWRSQIDDSGVRAAPQAVGNTFVFQVTPEDAAVFARGFNTLPNTESPVLPSPVLSPSPLHSLKNGGEDRFAWQRTPRHVTDSADLLIERIQPDIDRLRDHYWNAPMADLKSFVSNETRSSRGEPPTDYQIAERIRQRHFDATGVAMQLADDFNFVARNTLSLTAESYVIAREKNDSQAADQLAGIEQATVVAARKGIMIAWREWMGEIPLPDPLPCYAGRHDERIPEDEVTGTWSRLCINLKRLGDLLADYPIYMAASLEDIERAVAKMKQPPTKEQIAGHLTRLPNFHAHCKIKQGDESVELTVAIDRIEPPEVSYEAEIRERSRRLYCVTMEEAMAMISARQEDEQPVETEIVFLDAPLKRGGV